MTQAQEHTVPTDAPRLDQYLVGLLAGQSRSQVQRLIAEGHVRLNDEPARAGSRLRSGDRLSWEVPATVPTRLQPEAMELRVLYEDGDLVVIDKPAGLVVHPGPGHATGTLVHGLLGRGPGWSTIGGTERPGIVHRLDRDTSGLMVVARNDDTHRELARQLQRRIMTRKYRAIVVGEVADPAARIEAPIGRDPKNRQRMAVIPGGRDAVTEFRRLGVARGHSLLDVKLGTGRTHQIRVHLAYIHHPVLGDPVYGRRSPLIARPALHAEVLIFRHPRTGKSMTWQTPPPDDFELAWNSLGEHQSQPKMR
ncbi:MAG: RluA family pseudouridine synthase [Candidatus Dormibacteraeota bacterium]|nr:RluA family pseudouridine synthase [Candidatus Dormibacteraeota bacterium]